MVKLQSFGLNGFAQASTAVGMATGFERSEQMYLFLRDGNGLQAAYLSRVQAQAADAEQWTQATDGDLLEIKDACLCA